MTQSIQISEEIKKSLKYNCPEVLDYYKSLLEVLEDIEIHD